VSKIAHAAEEAEALSRLHVSGVGQPVSGGSRGPAVSCCRVVLSLRDATFVGTGRVADIVFTYLRWLRCGQNCVTRTGRRCARLAGV